MDNYVLLLHHNPRDQHDDSECGPGRTTPNHCAVCALLSTQNRHCIAQYERAMNMAITVYQLELQLVEGEKQNFRSYYKLKLPLTHTLMIYLEHMYCKHVPIIDW